MKELDCWIRVHPCPSVAKSASLLRGDLPEIPGWFEKLNQGATDGHGCTRIGYESHRRRYWIRLRGPGLTAHTCHTCRLSTRLHGPRYRMDMVTVVGSFSRVFEGASRGCQANPDPLPNTLRRPSNRSAFRACSSALVRVHPWPWVLVLAAFTAANAAQLSLPSLTAPPGTSLLLPVTFASQSAAATGLQFDLQYDDSVITLSATVGGAARISSKILYLWDVVPGQRRFFILGLNRDLVADGALVNLF